MWWLHQFRTGCQCPVFFAVSQKVLRIVVPFANQIFAYLFLSALRYRTCVDTNSFCSVSNVRRIEDYFVNLQFLAVDLANLPSLFQPEPRLEMNVERLKVHSIAVDEEQRQKNL